MQQITIGSFSQLIRRSHHSIPGGPGTPLLLLLLLLLILLSLYYRQQKRGGITKGLV